MTILKNYITDKKSWKNTIWNDFRVNNKKLDRDYITDITDYITRNSLSPSMK